jgi:hypothetical protein
MDNPNNKLYKCKAVQDSMRFHETSHLNEFRLKVPTMCSKVQGKRTLGFSTWDEFRTTELIAFNAQLDYLAKARRNACLSPDCEAEINWTINWILNTAIPSVINGTYGR